MSTVGKCGTKIIIFTVEGESNLCLQTFNKYAEETRDHKLSKYKLMVVRIRKTKNDKWK